MKRSPSLLLLAAMATCGNALASDLKPDGLWKGNGGAALSISSGNSQSNSLNLTTNAARQTADDKLSLYAQVLGSRSTSTSGGVTTTTTTANQWMAGTRYDHNISGKIFEFAGLDFNRDQIKLLDLGSAASGGLGYHMVKTTDNQLDVLGGFAYRADQYHAPGVLIHNEVRTEINTTELVLGEESHHKLTDSTSFNQKLTVYPELSHNKGTRVAFDAGLQVAINQTMSLSMTLQDRYDSLAELPVKKNDLLFLTGINVKFGG